jgi:hypothetical protein
LGLESPGIGELPRSHWLWWRARRSRDIFILNSREGSVAADSAEQTAVAVHRLESVGAANADIVCYKETLLPLLWLCWGQASQSTGVSKPAKRPLGVRNSD